MLRQKLCLHGAARVVLVLGALLGARSGAVAQQTPSIPPAVGVVTVTSQAISPSSEYIGRMQATDRVNLVARVAAYLDQRLFTDGAEVRKGDLLYQLEQGPFQADVDAKHAAVEQFKAQLQNAEVVLSRAQSLVQTRSVAQSTLDAALANQLALRAQVLGAEAQLQQSRINLSYTEIRAPIDGKIGRTAVTGGNYVTPSTGVLASIVSQDPMYVVFQVSTRSVIELSRRNEASGAVVIKIRLPDGHLFNQVGRLDFIDNTVAGNTDTMILRGIIPNPPLPNRRVGNARELVDGELVTVILEDAQPVQALTIPRTAVLTDQSGDYVYAVGSDHRAQQRRVRLGQSAPSPAIVVVTSGLSEGESVITEGIQRARPGQLVSPEPATSLTGSSGPAVPEDDVLGRSGVSPRRG
jgi:membrane fusion protein, multidrug efflux system